MIYKARKLQSHFDLVVQLYGDFSKIGEILKNIDDINGEIPLGTSFNVPVQNDPAALFFSNRGIIVQTDFLLESGDNFLLESGDNLLLEDGGLLLLE